MKEKFRIFFTIYAFLLSGMILAFIFTGKVDWNNLLNITDGEIPYLLIPVVAIVASELMFKSNMKQIDSKTDLNSRAGTYQTASLVRWAILEGAAFYSIMNPSIPKINILIILAYFIIIYPRNWKFEEIVSPK
jgi:hypothetical protein